MSELADVWIVSGRPDGVATRLRQALEARGRRVALLDGSAAARRFTIRIGSDLTSVAPSIPMFVRASAWYREPARPEDGPDGRFLKAEAYSTFWAAAALSAAPVINRPGLGGTVGRLTPGGIASVMGGNPGGPVAESYTSGPEALGELTGDETVWGEDASYLTGPVARLRTGTPLRARKVDPDALYEVVTVVGSRGFAATADPSTDRLDLIPQSVEFARRLGVHFATATWAVNGGVAAMARFNPTPEESELRYRWSDIAAALCEDLTS